MKRKITFSYTPKKQAKRLVTVEAFDLHSARKQAGYYFGISHTSPALVLVSAPAECPAQ